MSESIALEADAATPLRPSPQSTLLRLGVVFACWAFFLGNLAAIGWIWVANGNLPFHSLAEAMSRLGGLTGLLAAYLALIQVLLLARLPWLEHLAGFDRLTVWHRINGFACLLLVLAHTVMTVYGYGLGNHTSFTSEFWMMVGQGAFPGMVTATIGTALFVVVSISSLVLVRTRLPYELWYAVHLTAYAAIALAWFHEIPVGELALNPGDADYWRALFFGTLALLAFRVGTPLVDAFRFRLRVVAVVPEGGGVTSLRMSGRRLDRLGASAGQFFIWRFLAPGQWWSAHPFSLSAAPDGRSLRISVKASGDHSSAIGAIAPGTRVVAEGPFGHFTASRRRREKTLLLAGGIGITPVRALAEVLEGDVVIVHRVHSERDKTFAGELATIARERGLLLHYVVGESAGREPLSPAELRALVPDLAERDVYLCGPPGLIAALRRTLLRAGVSRRQLHIERFAL